MTAEPRQLATTATLDAAALDSEVLALAAVELARRFHRDGRLWCWSPVHPDHARHVAVEFIHPAVIGARALPAIAVHGAGAVEALAGHDDAVLHLGAPAPPAAAAGETAPATLHIAAADPMAWFDGRVVCAYHVLWELTQRCLDHPALLGTGRRDGGRGSDPTGFLYPFLDDRGEGSPAAGALTVADLEAEAAGKLMTSRALVESSEVAHAAELGALAGEISARMTAGGRVLSFGNGGSAADANLFAQLCTNPPRGEPLPARALAADPVVLTALANDLGAEHVFARQVGAEVRPGDVVLAFSTSGSSPNVLAGLHEARRREALTVALAGYAGGTVAARSVADRCFVVRSDSVHRIQEAQAALAASLWRRASEPAR